MKIQSQKSLISFTSTPIREVKIRNIENKAVKAMLTKLDPNDSGDIRALEQIKNKIAEKHSVLFNLCDEFQYSKFKNESFYAIEIENNSSPEYKKVAGLMQLLRYRKGDEDAVSMTRLAALPEYMKETPERKLKGVGESLFVHAFDYAKQINAAFLDFYSENNDFYIHVINKAKAQINAGIKVDLDMGKFKFFPEVYDDFIKLYKNDD